MLPPMYGFMQVGGECLSLLKLNLTGGEDSARIGGKSAMNLGR